MNTDRLQNNPGNVADAIPTTSRLTRRRTAGRNSGTSLVEVLIVLVIVLIGVFAVIQIFPIGFNTLRRSESRLRADHLARSTTETLTSSSDGLPESITFSYWDKTATGNQLNTVTNEDPDNMGTYQDLADNKLYFSNVNKYRYVRNEPIKVPLPNVTPVTANGNATGFVTGVGSIHYLAFGPIYMDSTVGDPTFAPVSQEQVDLNNSYLKITSDALFALPTDSTGNDGKGGDNSDTTASSRFAGLLRGTNSYLIDYGGKETDGAYIMFPPSPKARVFTISYTYQNNDRTIETQKSVDITIPASTATSQYVWYPLAPGSVIDYGGKLTGPNGSGVTGESIQPGSDVVVRGFERIRSNDGWDTNDPYQYKLMSSNVGTSDANVGVVAFNPAGANYSVPTSSGTKPFMALASYAVLDWHILRDDREVPAGTNGVARIRTNLPNIRVRDEEFVDFEETSENRNQIYPGLYPKRAIYKATDSDLPSYDESPDIQVFNLSDPNGAFQPLFQGDFSKATGVDKNRDYWVSKNGRGGTYPSGVLYINTTRIKPGSKLRVLYKAEGDWAVAFQKAATNYRINEAPPGNGNPTRPVAGIAESFGIAPMGSGYTDDRIYFHRSELNKGVTAVIEYDTAAGTNRLPARQFSIANADGDYSYANAIDIAPELGKVSGITGWRVFGNIRGASLKTRVIWHDNVNGRSPWRISDLETYVSQGAK